MINSILEKIRAAEAEAKAIAQKAVIRVQLIETDTQNKIETMKNEAADELIKNIKKLHSKKQSTPSDEPTIKMLEVTEANLNASKKYIHEQFRARYTQ